MLEVVFAVLLWYATILHSSVWVTGFFALCYLLWYTDGKEHTGERRWNAFRRFSLWRRIAPIDRFIETRVQLHNGGRAVKRIYVLYPCDTVFAALWAVGLHGGELEFADHLHFVVPPLLMACRYCATCSCGVVPSRGGRALSFPRSVALRCS